LIIKKRGKKGDEPAAMSLRKTHGGCCGIAGELRRDDDEQTAGR
jgi:hypothetical protein